MKQLLLISVIMIIRLQMQTSLNKDIYNQFDDALKERAKRGHFAEIAFIGLTKLRLKSIKKLEIF